MMKKSSILLTTQLSNDCANLLFLDWHFEFFGQFIFECILGIYYEFCQ
jgi:hypothetical protein